MSSVHIVSHYQTEKHQRKPRDTYDSRETQDHDPHPGHFHKLWNLRSNIGPVDMVAL